MMWIGGNVFMQPDRLVPFVIDDHPLIVLTRDEDGVVNLNATFLDRFNLPVLFIQNNEVVLDTEVWDVTFEGTTLTIRNGSGDIMLEMSYSSGVIEISRGHLYWNGIDVVITPGGIAIAGPGGFRKREEAPLQENVFDFPVAFAIGRSNTVARALFRIQKISRYS